MRITQGNPELIGKLLRLANGDIDLVQRAIKHDNRLEAIVHYIIAGQGALK